MSTDFTLVIPTYNRPAQLARLLRYLDGVPWNISVLDSSETPVLIGGLYAKMAALFTYPSDKHPFDKFLDGVNRVGTEFCALCADDDLVMPTGIEACLTVLRTHPSVACIDGFAFSFIEKDGKPTLQSTLRLTDSITDPSPLVRVAELLGNYRALTYCVYRTATLRKVLTKANELDSLLGRELLAGALTAVEGSVVHIPCFSHGRSGEQGERRYTNWHPLEWFVKDADGLIKEYVNYRELLLTALEKCVNTKEDMVHCLDLIHLRYLLAYCPNKLLEFIISHMAVSGKIPVEAGWPQEMRDLLSGATHDSKLTPIFGSDAIEEVQKCLQRFGEKAVDITT